MLKTPTVKDDYKNCTFDMFRHSAQRELLEINSFNKWRGQASKNKSIVVVTIISVIATTQKLLRQQKKLWIFMD
jgi:hypothetical protein